jgi:hypothetical protein
MRSISSTRLACAAALAAASLAACGSSDSGTSSGPGGTGTTPSATPRPASPTPTPAPAGPASAQIVLSGDPTVSGPLTLDVDCFEPRLEGPSIALSGKLQGGVAVIMVIRDGYVDIRLLTSQPSGREFTGTGTTGFDNGKGVSVSGPVGETTPAGGSKGSIGAVTSVSGSVSCGGEGPGTSTVRITGTTADGSVDATPAPVHVVCANGSSGLFVEIKGLTTIAGQPALILISLNQTSLQMSEIVQGKPGHFYLLQGHGATMSANSGHVDSDITEQVAAGAAAHTVHLAGDATCGHSTTY